MRKIWPTRADIPSELFTGLELRGLESVRAMLSSGQLDLRREEVVFLWSNRETADMPKRYQLEEWVAWKAARQELWVKIGTIAAICCDRRCDCGGDPGFPGLAISSSHTKPLAGWIRFAADRPRWRSDRAAQPTRSDQCLTNANASGSNAAGAVR